MLAALLDRLPGRFAEHDVLMAVNLARDLRPLRRCRLMVRGERREQKKQHTHHQVEPDGRQILHAPAGEELRGEVARFEQQRAEGLP